MSEINTDTSGALGDLEPTESDVAEIRGGSSVPTSGDPDTGRVAAGKSAKDAADALLGDGVTNLGTISDPAPGCHQR